MFGRFHSVFETFGHYYDIQEFLSAKVKQISENSNQSEKTNPSNMRSIFIKVAPIYDILPNDVIINIIKYVPVTRHRYQCMHFLPSLSKTFKSIMYENVSVLYNKYKITTKDDGMPMTVSDETLRLHLYHRNRSGKIQFIPSLGISVFNVTNYNANDDSDAYGTTDTMANDHGNTNDLNVVTPVLSGLNKYWNTYEMNEIMNDDSFGSSDSSFSSSNDNFGSKSKKIAFKKSDINIDKIDFPFHLIKQLMANTM